MHVMPARPYPFYNSDNMVRGAHLMLLPLYTALFSFFFVFSFSLLRETHARAHAIIILCYVPCVYKHTPRRAHSPLHYAAESEENMRLIATLGRGCNNFCRPAAAECERLW
jgi:hypothetical protein